MTEKTWEYRALQTELDMMAKQFPWPGTDQQYAGLRQQVGNLLQTFADAGRTPESTMANIYREDGRIDVDPIKESFWVPGSPSFGCAHCGTTETPTGDFQAHRYQCAKCGQSVSLRSSW